MKISFDLDDTLILTDNNGKVEKRNLQCRLLGIEELRKGTISLFKELGRRKHTICIYTTSYRTVVKIKLMFWLYGIPVHQVINQAKHQVMQRKYNVASSKYPPAFRIDVHVDDSIGVLVEGQRLGFKVIQIDKNKEDWVSCILAELNDLEE